MGNRYVAETHTSHGSQALLTFHFYTQLVQHLHLRQGPPRVRLAARGPRVCPDACFQILRWGWGCQYRHRVLSISWSCYVPQPDAYFSLLWETKTFVLHFTLWLNKIWQSKVNVAFLGLARPCPLCPCGEGTWPRTRAISVPGVWERPPDGPREAASPDEALGGAPSCGASRGRSRWRWDSRWSEEANETRVKGEWKASEKRVKSEIKVGRGPDLQLLEFQLVNVAEDGDRPARHVPEGRSTK